MIFADPAEARAHVADLESNTYYLAHNESSRPEYKVMRADRLPEYLTWSL
jgi:hypothetical protein